MTADKMMAQLQLYADDPMWADHAEVPKRLLHEAIAALRSSAVGAGATCCKGLAPSWECRCEIERLRALSVRPEAPAGVRAEFEAIINSLNYDGPDTNSLTVGEIRRALL